MTCIFIFMFLACHGLHTVVSFALSGIVVLLYCLFNIQIKECTCGFSVVGYTSLWKGVGCGTAWIIYITCLKNGTQTYFNSSRWVSEHLSSPSVFCVFHVTRLFFSTFPFDHCVVCPSSFGHCVFCPSSTYRFWLPLWYLLAMLLYVLLWYTDSVYPFGIFKLFLQQLPMINNLIRVVVCSRLLGKSFCLDQLSLFLLVTIKKSL